MVLVFGEIKGHLFLFLVMCCLQNKEAFMKLGRISSGICGLSVVAIEEGIGLIMFFLKTYCHDGL
jgi:hypothetical protein